jgi:peptide/nickel transport system permease protein
VALNRLGEAFLAFPIIILIILLLSLFGNNIFVVVAVLGLAGWVPLFKVVKTEILVIKSKNYFQTSLKLGLSRREILFKEIIPVIRVPLIVNLVFQFANIILAEAALSYLGLGAGVNFPTWGSMISSGQEYIFTAWWLILFPSLSLVALLIAVNYSGERLNLYFNPGLE